MPTLHHSLDRGNTFILARLLVPRANSLTIAGSRIAEFAVSDRGVDRLRANGCFDEGDYVPASLLDDLITHGEASRRVTGGSSRTTIDPRRSRPRLFPEPQPPCWMLPRRHHVVGL